MGGTGRALTAGAAVVGLAVGARWLWRHQGEVATSRPFNEWTFTHTSALMPTETVPSAVEPRSLRYAPIALDGWTYEYAGERRTLADLHKRTFTTGFAVLHRGLLVHESYPGWFASPQARFQLFSLTKSVTSMLVGIALEEGAIASLDRTAVSYLPELAGTAYDDRTIEHLLHMSSGAAFVEKYTDPDATISRFEHAVMGDGSLLEVLRTVPSVAKPGTVFNYSTMAADRAPGVGRAQPRRGPGTSGGRSARAGHPAALRVRQPVVDAGRRAAGLHRSGHPRAVPLGRSGGRRGGGQDQCLAHGG